MKHLSLKCDSLEQGFSLGGSIKESMALGYEEGVASEQFKEAQEPQRNKTI